MRKWIVFLWLVSSAAIGQTHDCTVSCTIVSDPFPLPPELQPDTCTLYVTGLSPGTSPVVTSGGGVACQFLRTYAEGFFVSGYATASFSGVESGPSNTLSFLSTRGAPPAPINARVAQDSGGSPMSWLGPTTNLTHRWPLDAANTGNDVVGALNGTVVNATQTAGPSGAANTAYHLDSPGGYVDIGATAPISFTGAWSVGYWVKFDSLDSYAVDGDPSPVDFDDGAGHAWRSTFSDTSTGAPNQYISESGTPNIWVHSGLTLATGVWYHKVVTFDGITTYKVYLSGALLTAVTDGSGNGTSANNIFGGRAATARLVHGAMAQVVTYSKELTAGEVATLYAADSPGAGIAFIPIIGRGPGMALVGPSGLVN